MRFFLLLVAVFSSVQSHAGWLTPRGISVGNLDSVCAQFVALAYTHSVHLVSKDEAVQFLLTQSGNSLTSERRKKIEQSAAPGAATTSFIVEGNEIPAVLSHPYADYEHREHVKARGRFQNIFFCMELTLTVLVVALLKLKNIDLGQVTGVPQLGNQAVQIGIGGFISRVSSGWLSYLAFGRSYKEFADKVAKAIQNESTSPLSYGHGVVTGKRFRIEILYAPDKDTSYFSPRLLVHVMGE